MVKAKTNIEEPKDGFEYNIKSTAFEIALCRKFRIVIFFAVNELSSNLLQIIPFW